MRLLYKTGRVLLQNVPGLIGRAPDHLVQSIGFAREDLITFFKRHNAIFQMHTDGTVSVKSDAVRTLLNKNDNLQISPSSTPNTSLQASPAMTASGIVIRIFPKYGILNMDNNEQVFFDIQSCHFETFNDLTCVLNPGDAMSFNAILGPKEGTASSSVSFSSPSRFSSRFNEMEITEDLDASHRPRWHAVDELDVLAVASRAFGEHEQSLVDCRGQRWLHLAAVVRSLPSQHQFSAVQRLLGHRTGTQRLPNGSRQQRRSRRLSGSDE